MVVVRFHNKNSHVVLEYRSNVHLLENMGELVAGVGDEVLLFATFLILSACMYVSVLLYRSHGNRQSTEQPAPQGMSSQ